MHPASVLRWGWPTDVWFGRVDALVRAVAQHHANGAMFCPVLWCRCVSSSTGCFCQCDGGPSATLTPGLYVYVHVPSFVFVSVPVVYCCFHEQLGSSACPVPGSCQGAYGCENSLSCTLPPVCGVGVLVFVKPCGAVLWVHVVSVCGSLAKADVDDRQCAARQCCSSCALLDKFDSLVECFARCGGHSWAAARHFNRGVTPAAV